MQTTRTESTPDPGGQTPLEELFLLRLRYREGRLVELGANKPFQLDDPETAWVVYAGKVDIFVVSLHNGEVVGPRRHLLRAEAGQAFFSIGRMDAEGGIGLLAVGVGGTRVLRVKRERLQEFAANPAHRQEVVALLDVWVNALGRIAASTLPPKDCELLDPETEVTFGPNVSACARRDVVWIRCTEGTATFLGREDLPAMDGETRLPLSKQTFIRTLSITKLDTIGTEAYASQDTAWQALDQFHALVLTCIRLQAHERERAEQVRLESKAEADRRGVQRTLSELVSILQPRQERPFDEGDDPLFTACRLVGEAQGIAMRRRHVGGQEPAAANSLAQIARASRVRTRDVALTEGWWRQDNGPLLGFAEVDGHPIALLPTSPRSYDLIDPIQHLRKPVNGALAATLSSSAVMFYRSFANRAITARDLCTFGLLGGRGDLLMLVLMGIGGGALALLTPIVTGILFNSVIPAGDRTKLAQITAALLVGAVAALLFELTRGIAVLRLTGRLDASIQSAVWDRLLALPVPFFRHYSTGDLANRALGINAIRQILTGATVASILGAIFSVFNLALMFYYSASLAIVAAILVLLILAFTVATSYRQVVQQRPMLDLQGRISGLVLEMLTGIAKLRMTGSEDRAFAVWAREFAKQKRIAFRVRRTANTQTVFDSTSMPLTILVIFGFVAWSLNQQLSSGTFLGFYTAFTQFFVAVIAMNAAFISVLNIFPVYDRLRPVLCQLPEVDVDKTDPGELTGEIEVSHVSFRYKEDGPLVLNDVSLQIKPGEFVAIVGPSGSGKSSLLRVLLGFEAPESGSIYYDGQDLGGLDVQSVRRQIGVVLQNGKPMRGSIASNITGSTGRTIEDAWVAAQMAGLDADINRMPMGMHTVISESASTFSGGQRQRLMIARAVVGKPRILFFDEATSALDSKTQEQVSKSLESLQATRLVIAHRLSTIIHADRIFVISAGHVVQSGTYQQLLNQPGQFAQLVRRQLA